MKRKPTEKVCKNCSEKFIAYRMSTATCSYACSFILRKKNFPKCLEKSCKNKVLDYRAKYCRNCYQLSENNPAWKGINVGYYALHEWVTRKLPKTEFCQICKVVPPYDLANISQEYKRDLFDWEWLCRKCHMLKDGRLFNLIKNKNEHIRSNRNNSMQMDH